MTQMTITGGLMTDTGIVRGIGAAVATRYLRKKHILGIRRIRAQTWDPRARSQSFFARYSFAPIRHTDGVGMALVGIA
jgi:hypothetical protein